MNIATAEYKRRKRYTLNIVEKAEGHLDKPIAKKELGETRVNDLVELLGRVAVPEFRDGKVDIGDHDPDSTFIVPLRADEEVILPKETIMHSQTQREAAVESYIDSGMSEEQAHEALNSMYKNIDGEQKFVLPKNADANTTSVSLAKKIEAHNHDTNETIRMAGLLAMRPVIFIRCHDDQNRVKSQAGQLTHELVHYQRRNTQPYRMFSSSLQFRMADLSEELYAYHVGAVVEAGTIGKPLDKVVKAARRGDMSDIKRGGVNLFIESFRRNALQQYNNDYEPSIKALNLFNRAKIPILHNSFDIDGFLED